MVKKKPEAETGICFEIYLGEGGGEDMLNTS